MEDKRCHGSTTGPDHVDVARMLRHLEAELGGQIKITITGMGTGKFASMMVDARLYRYSDSEAEATCWASARITIPGSGVGDTNMALLSLLYDLDRSFYRTRYVEDPE